MRKQAGLYWSLASVAAAALAGRHQLLGEARQATPSLEERVAETVDSEILAKGARSVSVAVMRRQDAGRARAGSG